MLFLLISKQLHTNNYPLVYQVSQRVEMVWALFRLLCCLCANMEHCRRSRGESYLFEDSEDDSDQELHVNKRAIRLSKLKLKAIAKTANVIVAEELLRENTEDLGLIMYHNQCSHKMNRALDKLYMARNKPKKSTDSQGEH